MSENDWQWLCSGRIWEGGGVFKLKQGVKFTRLESAGKRLLHTAERVGLIWGCSFCVTTQAVEVPALSHMELCLLLAAMALKINTASIKPIKVNKVHWMKFPLAALAKHHPVMFLRMQCTWIHGWRSIRRERLVLLMNKCSLPWAGGGKVTWRGCERGLWVRLWTAFSRAPVKGWNTWQIPNHLQALLKHGTRYNMYSTALCRYSAQETGW